jgi:RNA polymerase sigma-70 factor (ECF subfamily)
MRAHFELVLRRLRRLGVPASDLDDAAQDVFVVAARRIDDMLVDCERAFLLGTAARVASTRRRSARRHREDVTESFDEHHPDPSGPDARCELVLARPFLRGMLARMSDDTRAVFVLAEVEELAAPEIAERLAIPIGTVGSRLRRARSELRGEAKRLLAREAFAWKGTQPHEYAQSA